MIRLLIIMILISSFFIPNTSQAGTVVVVSKSSSLSTLDDKLVANIFLARTNRYPNGEKALPIELNDEGSRNSFYGTITGKSSNQLSAYWTTLIFTGKGTPPRSFDNMNQLITQVIEQPGTIAYIDSEKVTKDLKVIYTFP